MLALFNRIRISRKLPAIMVALTALAITLMGVVAYQNSRGTIQTAVADRLSGIATSRATAFESWLETVVTDLGMQTSSPTISTAFLSFAAAWEHLDEPVTQLHQLYIEENPNPAGERQELVEVDSDLSYAAHHARIHPFYKNLLEQQGYADIFLIDPEGNVVYSVRKEAEFATNVMDGAYAESGLGDVFRKAVELESGAGPAFVDFSPYAPSNGVPASFIAQPVFDVGGQFMGVVAYQMPVDGMDAILSDSSGLGETGATYLVGEDFLMRSNSRLVDEQLIFSREVRNEAVEMGLAGQTGHAQVIGHRGTETETYFQPIGFHGVDWVLVAEQDTAELFAPAVELRNSFIWQGGAMIAVAALVSILLSRSISNPLGRVGTAMSRIAGRDYETEVPDSGRGDEIGGIAGALEEFRVSLSEAEEIGRDAAFKGAAFEGSSAPMMMADTDFNITFVNSAMRALFTEHAEEIRKKVPEFDPEQLVGKNMDVFHQNPAHQRRIVSDLSKLPITVDVQLGETCLTILVSGVRDGEGNHLGVVTEWQDTTRIRRNSAILGALDASQIWIDMDGEGRIVGANGNFCELLHVEPDAVVGRAGDAVLAPEGDVEAERTHIEAAMSEGRTHSGRFHVTIGTTQAVIEGSLTPVLDTQGRLSRRVLIANDVTEAQQALAAAEAERKAAAEAQAKVVEALGAALEQLSDGDMTTAIDAQFAPEYERLREDFNRAMGKLLSAMRAVVENSGAISGEVQGITQASNELSARTENQAATLEETAAALDQLTASVKSSAERAAQAAQVVNEARSSAEDSGSVVREAVDAMGEIEESSKKISKIIGVIDDIAFQTNLLALNAGVEAARAGDAGRGFAVVASEVRALAQRSSEAAREINGLISSSGAQVKRGVGLVGEAGKALEQIVASVAGIAGHVDQIASSSSEQSQGLVEINQAMTQLDQVTQQNAAMFEETSGASQALARAADTLSETVGRFRTDNGSAAPIPFRAAAAKAETKTGANPAAGPAPKRKMVSAAPQAAADEDDGWAEF